jgi:hypothetical protein
MNVQLLLAALAGSGAAAATAAAAAPASAPPGGGAWFGLHNPSTDALLEGCALKEGGPCATHANVTFYDKTVSNPPAATCTAYRYRWCLC